MKPLATIVPPAGFVGLVVALNSSAAVVGFGIDGTMWSSEAAAQGTFSAPRRIDVGAPRFARGPALALTPGGVAVAAWEQPDVDQFRGPMLVWANRLSPGTGWGDPMLVERRVTAPEQVDPVTANLAPDVAVSPSGEAVVLWAARDVFASVSQDGQVWSEPERLDTRRGAQSPYGKRLRVAAGARGRFLAAWANGPDGRVAWREPASGWGPTTSFRVDAELLMDGPILAADATGRALVAWQALELDSRGFVSHSRGVFATVWSESSGWGPLSRLSGPDVEAFLIDVALDGAGGGAAVWSDRELRLWLSRLSADGTWAPAELVPGATLTGATAFLPRGELLIVWTDGPAVLALRRRGASWSSPETLQDGSLDPQRLMSRVALAANERGEALAGWTSYQTSREGPRGMLWTSRLRVP